MILNARHPDLGTIKVPGIVPKLTKTPGQVKWLGPKLGENNEQILKEIGLTDAQIIQLYQKGVI